MSHPKPLQGFKRLSQITWLYEPEVSTTTERGPLVLLATWMNAPVRLIDRYVDQVKICFPSSTILLITNTGEQFFFTTASKYSVLLSPAIAVLQRLHQDEKVIALSFSNGGALSLTQLAQQYRKATNRPLPLKNLVLDSAPGTADLVPAHAAIYAGFPRALTKGFLPIRLFVSGLLWLFLGLFWVVHQVFGLTDRISALRVHINDTKLFLPGTSRTYIYSQADVMVPYRAVEASAEHAKQLGWNTRVELFTGRHVAHAVVEKERYWTVVEQALRGQ